LESHPIHSLRRTICLFPRIALSKRKFSSWNPKIRFLSSSKSVVDDLSMALYNPASQPSLLGKRRSSRTISLDSVWAGVSGSHMPCLLWLFTLIVWL
jgi:hypothetical protein